VQDDAAVKNATQAWTACMARNGYRLGQPDTVFRQEIEAMFGGTHVSPSSAVTPNPAGSSQSQPFMTATRGPRPGR
jgi:hypothetical protein